MNYNHSNVIKVLNENFKLNLKLNEEKFGETFEIDTNDVNHAVIAFTNILNISSGSTGERDLYKLLQIYLSDSNKQKAINEILRSK